MPASCAQPSPRGAVLGFCVAWRAMKSRVRLWRCLRLPGPARLVLPGLILAGATLQTPAKKNPHRKAAKKRGAWVAEEVRHHCASPPPRLARCALHARVHCRAHKALCCWLVGPAGG